MAKNSESRHEIGCNNVQRDCVPRLNVNCPLPLNPQRRGGEETKSRPVGLGEKTADISNVDELVVSDPPDVVHMRIIRAADA